MTEAERKSFFAHSSARAPGKRQIKTNAAMLLASSIADNDDDDDDDFVVPKGAKAEDSVSEESGSGSDSDDDGASSDSSEIGERPNFDESDESDDDDEGIEHDGDKTLVKQEPSEDVTKNCGSINSDNDSLICSLCLNLRAVVKNEEVIRCDRCGVAVHENCYMVESVEEEESDHSSASTVPWFCEPCLYELKEPPYCELCPSRYGAFKKSDIGGGWVHLLCALYTPGITFGDVDRLSAVSWQELDFKLFGKKQCMACTNPIMARTGIAVACDAALCKNHLHVTCAQKLGLLVDNSDASGELQTGRSNSRAKKEEAVQNWYASDADVVDPRFVTCRRHCDSEATRERRLACARFYRQEEARMRFLNRRMLTEREERKRVQSLERHRKTMKNLEGITISWPEHENKRPRWLHTSPRFVDSFADKADSDGVSRENFFRNFTKVDGVQLPFLPVGFSHEFLSYMEARDGTVIPAEKKREEELKRDVDALKLKQIRLEKELATLEKGSTRTRASDPTLKLLTGWSESLRRLGVKKVCDPSAPRQVSRSRKSAAKGSAQAKSTTTAAGATRRVPSKPRGRRQSSTSKPQATLKRKRRAEVTVKTEVDDQSAGPILDPSAVLLHECDTCHKTHDQHLLVTCDKCVKRYHLACLDPPLKRMPKKTRMQGWECSVCCESSDEDKEEPCERVSNEGSDDATSSRRLRDRSGLKEKKIEEEKAQKRAFRAAIHKLRVPWAGKYGGSPVLPVKDVCKRKVTSPLSVKIEEEDCASGPPTAQSPTMVSPPRKRRRANSIEEHHLVNGTAPAAINGVRHASEIGSPRESQRPLAKESRRRSCTSRADSQSPTHGLKAPGDTSSQRNGLIQHESPR